MNNTILLLVLTAVLFSCKQRSKSTPENTGTQTLHAEKNKSTNKDIYSKYAYADSVGKHIIVQNSYPKGGMKYTDPNGRVCGYAVFWTRISNETDYTLELKIDVPMNSYPISNFPGKYFKVLVPADTMTPDKSPLLLYGLTDIDTFLYNNRNKPSFFTRTIHSKEASGFYFLLLVMTEEATGMTRAELQLKGQELYYKISRYSATKPITLLEEKEIHCGSIHLKNQRLQQ